MSRKDDSVYFGHMLEDISQDVLWEVVTRDIPPLEAQLARIAPPEAADAR